VNIARLNEKVLKQNDSFLLTQQDLSSYFHAAAPCLLMIFCTIKRTTQTL